MIGTVSTFSESAHRCTDASLYGFLAGIYNTLLFPQNKRAFVSLLAVRRTQVAEMLQHQHGEPAEEDTECTPCSSFISISMLSTTYS
jgi:hypothetical protein